jgi:hypothetical protein
MECDACPDLGSGVLASCPSNQCPSLQIPDLLAPQDAPVLCTSSLGADGNLVNRQHDPVSEVIRSLSSSVASWTGFENVGGASARPPRSVVDQSAHSRAESGERATEDAVESLPDVQQQ